MTARILVVDDIPANVKLLEAWLSAEYFDVLTASSGPEALAVCQEGSCDIVLLDVMMPGMDGFEACRRIKNNPATAHLPVVMVTALDQPADRVRGLEAGADDFLTKPIDEVALIARVRSLARLKVVIDELRSGASKALSPGAREGSFAMTADDGQKGRILLVDDRPSSSERIVQALCPHHEVTVETNAHQALFKAAEDDCDLFIVSLGLQDYDGLRLCSRYDPSSAREISQFWRSPRPTTALACSARSILASTTISRGRSIAMNCWRARGRNCVTSAMPTACATRCSNRSSWRWSIP
jgi:two-component system cell cycle response regulator